MSAKPWTFLSNHGHVLVYLANHPLARLKDISQAVGITERSAQGIVADLQAEGYLEIEKTGRQNKYKLFAQARFRHPAEAEHQIGELLSIFRS